MNKYSVNARLDGLSGWLFAGAVRGLRCNQWISKLWWYLTEVYQKRGKDNNYFETSPYFPNFFTENTPLGVSVARNNAIRFGFIA